MEYAQIADYLLRPANPDDQAQIYHLKAQSVRPYVEKIWGWDEVYQQQDFARDFQAIERFQVIEVGGNFAGFLQASFLDPYYEIQELHLLPAYRGKGIGSQILRQLQEACTAQGQTIRIGCFRENQRAKRAMKSSASWKHQKLIRTLFWNIPTISQRKKLKRRSNF